MSVSITPLPGGDALIVTPKFIMFIRHVHAIRFHRQDKPQLVGFLGGEKFSLHFDDRQIIDDVCKELFKLDLVYNSPSGETVFPKLNVMCAYEEFSQTTMLCSHYCRTEKFVISISKETFVRIQEDLMLRHAEATELEKLKHENMLMRAHIEFSPDGPKFLETMNNLKARAKVNSTGC